MPIYDLTHSLSTGMPIFPGDPAVVLEPVTAAAPWRVSRLALGSHSGTHIDAPLHFFAEGRSITDYPLERFVRPAVVLRLVGLNEDQPIEASALDPIAPSIRPGIALLIATGWDRYWGTDRYFRHPYLSPRAVQRLVEWRVSIVGVDALNVDSTPQGTTHAHATLLGVDILIIENLRGLSTFETGRVYGLGVFPLPLEGADGAPARVLAWELGESALLSELTSGMG